MITSFLDPAQKKRHIWLCQQEQNWFRNEYVNADYVRSNLAHESVRGGRGVVTYFTVDGHDLVMRHGTRGGLMSVLLQDRYFRTGLTHRRCAKELLMLDRMRNLQLPVPVPVAAASVVTGPYYRYELITRRIAGARSLVSRLQSEPINEDVWQRVGATLARFHDALVWHADLNAGNILIDDVDQVFVIDFDRSAFKRSSGKWRQHNLMRLRHSLQQLQRRLPNFYYRCTDFENLLRGYTGG